MEEFEVVLKIIETVSVLYLAIHFGMLEGIKRCSKAIVSVAIVAVLAVLMLVYHYDMFYGDTMAAIIIAWSVFVLWWFVKVFRSMNKNK